MLAFALRRVLLAIPFVLGAATLVFVLLEAAPGDPTDQLLGDRPIPPEVRARIERAYGLDRTPAERYVAWLTGLVHGDLGWSPSRGRPVLRLLGETLPATLLLAGTALALQAILGVGLGTLGALRRGRASDRALGTVALLLCSMPLFWIGLVAILLFAYFVPLFPSGGMRTVGLVSSSWIDRTIDVLRHLVLPASILGLTSAAALSRFVRASVGEALDLGFVRAARARGLAERRVVLGHALRNGLGTALALTALSLPVLVSGSLVVEVVFSWPGMGRLSYEAIRANDVSVVLAGTVLSATLVAVGSLGADLALAVLDPRVRLERARGAA